MKKIYKMEETSEIEREREREQNAIFNRTTEARTQKKIEHKHNNK
jgi:hypothetical protein